MEQDRGAPPNRNSVFLLLSRCRLLPPRISASRTIRSRAASARSFLMTLPLVS